MAWNLSDPDEDALIGWDDSAGDVVVYTLGDTLTTSTTTLDVDNTTVVTIDDAQTITGAKTFSDNVTVNATKKIFLDGGGDTYIHEASANVAEVVVTGNITAQFLASNVNLFSGGVQKFSTRSGGIAIGAGDKIFLDGVGGTGDTYITESSANVVQVVVGGTAELTVNSSGITTPGSVSATAATITGAVANARLDLITNDLSQTWRFQSTESSGAFIFRDATAGTNPLIINKTAPNDSLTIASSGDISIGNALEVRGNVGFYDTTPIAKPTVTGSRGGNAALADLLTELANLGLITDSSSA